ncbi:gamma-glutamyltranspeptidase domain-containing protein [Hirsutella rhossiliensis]|uniref:Gamma-glutamyltranspeptidase domain-containing protein n=1 Tax=Hirsutella rhossiliensis TaxID=111463 RepID=A0A9P8MUG0_9HYPO|nr:gamma-glutamyltranspeptidase domain-containing protein [Hirsutella rhossiliensis]KAH0961440.1 gamma-glutamyltranspeptidase domain-containing protein [Hirsutella rhossiliensis]
MYHSGIGGGGFMLLRNNNGTYEFVDFRETAPKTAYTDMYEGNLNGSVYGGLASGVPAASIARCGFVVTEDLIQAMNRVSPNNFLTDDPTWAIDFAPHGYRVRLGETITRK